MKSVTIKNDSGETIEIKHDSEGVIQIRHSDLDPKSWGELHEYSKRLRQAEIQPFLKSKGLDADSPMIKEAAQLLGGYVVLGGKSYMISAAELALIHAAVKQDGGIIPNWSNRS